MRDIDKEEIKPIYNSSSQIYHIANELVQHAKGFPSKDLNAQQTFNLLKLT